LLSHTKDSEWEAQTPGVFEGEPILVIGDQEKPTCSPADANTFSVYRIERENAILLTDEVKKYWLKESAKQLFLIQKADGLYAVDEAGYVLK